MRTLQARQETMIRTRSKWGEWGLILVQTNTRPVRIRPNTGKFHVIWNMYSYHIASGVLRRAHVEGRIEHAPADTMSYLRDV